MKFKNLEDKCLYYRGLTDYKLLPNSYVIAMIDGRSFSKLIKNRFKKPFDDNFIDMMNQTAQYVCENVQGCKFAYVQSDEISFIISDFDTPTTDSFFGYRLSKMQSIIASLATAKFNQLMFIHNMENHFYINPVETIMNTTLTQFDCKCWNVPNENDAFAWLLFRQIDCVKNSKQQTAQTYLPKKSLFNKSSNEQIEMLKNEKNIDWNDFKNYEKYGRFVYKKKIKMENIETSQIYERKKWTINDAFDLTEENNKEKIIEIINNIN